MYFQISKPSIKKHNLSIMPIHNFNKQAPAPAPALTPVVENYIVAQPKESKKMTWGEPTWFFFHTLAEKIGDEHFTIVKNDLLNFIFLISSNLPCPICSVHAMDYLKTNNFYNISTKEQLIIFLFNFHNDVNKRKNYVLYDYNNLKEKYSKAKFINIINYFLLHFKNNTKSNKMISEDFHRNRIILKLKTWINNNIKYFNI
jgi:hypothetical protein